MASRILDERVMSAVAAGVAGRYGVKVAVSGTGAYSTLTPVVRNGRTVQVPEINIPAEVKKPSPEALVLLRGYLDHEAAHVRWSDWDVVASVSADHYLKSMLNVVEDVRIERLMSAAFPGAKANLHDIAVLLFGGDEWKKQLHALADRQHAAAMLSLSWALYRMRSMDVPVLEPGLEALSDVLDAVRPKTRPAMERALDRWLKANGWPASTKDALDLADALARAFRGTGSDGWDRTGQEAEEDAASALRGAGAGEAEADVLGNLAASAAGQKASQSARPGQAGEGIDGLAASTPGLGTLGNAVNGMLDGLDPDQGAGDDARRNGFSSFLPVETALREDMLKRWDPAMLSRSMNLCAGLGSRLASLLQTSARVMKGTGRTGRRLDGSVLWRAGAMDGRVFRSAARRQDASASVLLLIDVSGSMQGTEEELASAACVSVLNALDQVKGIGAGACVFTDDGAGRQLHSVIRMPGDRTPAAKLPRPGAAGCTDVARSMRHCAALLPADSPRRIMIVISDGEDSSAAIAAAERDLSAKGVLVAGVSVMSARLSAGLSRCRTAEKPEDIPAAVFGALQDVLLHGSGA